MTYYVYMLKSIDRTSVKTYVGFTNNLNKNQVACGELLIKEAGGYLTNLKYINAYRSSGDLLIGANPTLHKELLKKINNKF